MKNMCLVKIIMLLIPPFFLLSGCGANKASLENKKSLSESELSYYNDAFDNMREDLWEKSQLTYKRAQLDKFKLADMTFENGKVRIETQTGFFSKGGLQTKFVFRGNFDIQIDCHIDFIPGELDMDQRVGFGLVSRAKDLQDKDLVIVNLLKKPEMDRAILFSFCRLNRQFKRSRSVDIDSFHGTIRLVRKKGRVIVLYRTLNSDGWKDLTGFHFSAQDLFFVFALQNFDANRLAIKAEFRITTTFDNFKINSADAIVEEEI
jgi:hypothetical protein